MKNLKDLVDLINTDGGHILLATLLLFIGLLCVAHWQIAEGKELFIFALGVLGMAMKSTGKANGKSLPPAVPVDTINQSLPSA